MSVITLDTTLNGILQTGNNGLNLVKAATNIGDLVEAEVNIMRLHAAKKPHTSWQRQILSDPTKNNKSINLLNKKLRKLTQEEEWKKAIKVRIGVKMIKMLLESAKTKEGGQVFIHTVVFGNQRTKHGFKKSLGMLRLDDDLYDEIANNEMPLVLPQFLPMLVPPR